MVGVWKYGRKHPKSRKNAPHVLRRKMPRALWWCVEASNWKTDASCGDEALKYF